MTLVPNDTGSEFRYLVEFPEEAVVRIADATPVTTKAHAWVESRPFDTSTLMLPRPIEGGSYDLRFPGREVVHPAGSRARRPHPDVSMVGRRGRGLRPRRR